MAVKITDVAKYAGVSPAVVSRVLHHNGYVSDEKRAVVEIALKDLGYVPNQVAQGLKRQKTKMIGHILPSVHPNPFFAGVSYGIDTEADRLGYHVLTLFSYGDPKREEKLIEELVSRMVDGFIFTGAGSAVGIKKIKEMTMPIVMVERSMGTIGVDKVLVDNQEGAYEAVAHFIDNNHRKIAFIGVEPNGDIETERFAGYINALKENNITLSKEYIAMVPGYNPEEGYRAIEKIMSNKDKPTAVFAASDMLAIGILQWLYKKGLRVPDDISLIGYDDSLADFLSPKLTTVANPMNELGKSAVQLIVDKLESNRSVNKTVTLHTNLVHKESVKYLRKKE